MANSAALGEQIATRRTHKVLGDPKNPPEVSALDPTMLDNLLEQAGNAPVHYACDRIHLGDMSSPVPWRAYKFGRQHCLDLMNQRLADGDTTKVPNLLAPAQFLVQVTWLPDAGTIQQGDGSKDTIVFDGTLRNMEHIAAASSFVQSLLLVADAAGFRTYWSSGGPLRGPVVFEQMGIPATELLIGSVFLYPAETAGTDVKPGNMAERRGKVSDWSRWVE